MDYIEAIEKELGKKAQKIMMPLQPGDVPVTVSDTKELEKWIGFKPNTSIKEGISKFISWFKEFYNC